MSQSAALRNHAVTNGTDFQTSSSKAQYRPRVGPNPRRRLAKDAVSLRHDMKPGAVSSQNSSIVQERGLSRGPSLAAMKDNSSGETSNAENWFEKSNKNVSRQSGASNNSPPFFFQNSSTDSCPEGAGPPHLQLPYRPSVHQIASTGSNSEEYRSVIDDLTIQNQKLKKRLKKYERTREPRLDSDKLFEVKIHGLHPEKKRELEATLHQFAQSLKAPITTKQQIDQLITHTRPTLGNLVGMKKQTSSMSSTKIADSGYGSLTTFGPAASMANSNVHNPFAQSQSYDSHQPGSSANEASRSRDKHIQSYLHDIPEGLLPRHSPALTEKTKKKMVVQRLEQIFGGRGADPQPHNQPIQQQEVSHSAANDDRSAMAAQGQHLAQEGIREARIMEHETEDPMDFQSDSKPSSGETHISIQEPAAAGIEQQDFATAKPSYEQRPTRPLDLDPERAQIPKENIEYIRHLGFIVPGMKSPLREGGHWVYLNLLINMAQLHTINVTTEFVKKAVQEYSSKFELSDDGRKIRWRGGKELTHFSGVSSSDSSTDNTPVSLSSSNGQINPRKRSISQHNGCDDDAFTQGLSKAAKLHKSLKKDEKFTYTPIFPHKDDSDDSDEDSEYDMSQRSSLPCEAIENGDSSALASTLKQATFGARRRTLDGPIIFYNNAKFCIDLSGDQTQPNQPHQSVDFSAVTTTPLGAPVPRQSCNESSVISSPRFLTCGSAADVESAMQVDDDSSTSALEFPADSSSPKHVTFAEPAKPVLFEVSGIGGVYPADNLSISVTRQYKGRTSSSSTGRAQHRFGRHSSMLKAISLHLSQPHSPTDSSPLGESVLSAKAISLPPSELPPASYAYADDSDHEMSDASSEDDEEDCQNNTALATVHPTTIDHQLPRFAETPFFNTGASSSSSSQSCSPSSSNGEAGEDDEDDDDDEAQSLDFLAMARLANPEAIRAKERAYDAEMADRLAEEIPAGSSAATAGGGSGFTSPADANAGAAETETRKRERAADEQAEEEDDVASRMMKSVSS